MHWEQRPQCGSSLVCSCVCTNTCLACPLREMTVNGCPPRVPDFSKEPLMTSGLLLTSVAAQQTLTAQHDTEAEKVLPAPATSRRTFAQDDVLAVLAEIYDNNPSRQARQIEMSARLIADGGREIFVARDSLGNGGSDNAKNWETFSFKREIPLKDVLPGRYLLRIEARDRARTNDAPAATETVITVTSSRGAERF